MVICVALTCMQQCLIDAQTNPDHRAADVDIVLGAAAVVLSVEATCRVGRPSSRSIRIVECIAFGASVIAKSRGCRRRTVRSSGSRHCAVDFETPLPPCSSLGPPQAAAWRRQEPDAPTVTT